MNYRNSTQYYHRNQAIARGQMLTRSKYSLILDAATGALLAVIAVAFLVF